MLRTPAVPFLAATLLTGAFLAPGAASAQDFTREYRAMPHQSQSQQRHAPQDDWLYQNMVPVSPGQPAARPEPRGQWNRLGNLNTRDTGPARPVTQAPQFGRNEFRASSRTYGTDQRQANPHYGAVRSLNPPQGNATAAPRRVAPPQSAEPGRVRELDLDRY